MGASGGEIVPQLVPRQKDCRLNRQRICNTRENDDARIALPSLNSADIRQVNVCGECQLLLRQSRALSVLSHIRPDDSAPITHPPMNGGQAYIL